jgi:hypothetical protein
MADESHVVRGINWRETFPFTQLFRAFRVAIHPTKLILALVALLALYAGGRLLDALWPVQHRAIPSIRDDRGRVVRPSEVAEFETFAPNRGGYADFEHLRKARRAEVEDNYVRVLRDETKAVTDEGQAREAARTASRLDAVEVKTVEKRDAVVKEATDAREKAKAAAEAAYKAEGGNAAAAKKRDDAVTRADDEHRAAVQQAHAGAAAYYERARSVRGQGIFMQFFEYEIAQVNNVAWSVLANNWLGGFGGNADTQRPGVFRSVANFCVTGPWWMASQHTTYFILFLVLFSIVWAIFGGAIARIAAVHVARDEKISLSSALRFSTGKFLSFIFAPVIPLMIVLAVGLVVALGGLLGNVPFVGPILLGLFFFLALAAGFVMTLVLLGTGGGFNLMYPTIAVEGSDSFDAISRSFSYVYARPWRMLFYTFVALLYGALCFLFVRFFLAIMLILTHRFVGAGMVSNVQSGVPVDLWGAMWPINPGQLTYSPAFMSLGGGQTLGAALVAFWVYVTISMLGAFAISFYFSANTIIYYLMRREVDATELDDVYLEQSEEDFGDSPASATSAPAAAATTTGGTATVLTAPATTTTTGGGAQVFPAPGDAARPPTA